MAVLSSPSKVSIEKIVAFEYFLSCLLEKETGEDVKALTKDKINETLSKYGWIHINKLLYFTVLQSQMGKNTDGKTPLLGIFDKFTAYPKGPVEADIYENRIYGIFFAFDVKADNNKLVLRDYSDIDKRISYIKESDGLEEEVRDLIKKSVDTIYGWTKDLSTDDLVAKSHILPFWRKAFQESIENNGGAITVGDISEIWQKAVDEGINAELEAYKEQSYQYP